MPDALMPALFIGHGSPMNAIEDNPWTQQWRALGALLPRPRAVLCVSAHWQTAGVFIGGAAKPRTIHDFGGFPPRLYEVEYPAPGAPELARELLALLPPALDAGIEADYGLDHGAWQVLLHLFPRADVPVLQLSLDLRRPAVQHFAIGRALAGLRESGVLILGSGNIVHNLRRLDVSNPAPPAWATGFRDRVSALIAAGDFSALCRPEALPDFQLAAPTPEHYLPLLYVLACARQDEGLSIFNDEVWSTMSMTSLGVGLPQ